MRLPSSSIFFFNDTATTEIYTLSLHDALPISRDRFPELAQPEREPRRTHSKPTAADPRKPEEEQKSKGGSLCPEGGGQCRRSESRTGRPAQGIVRHPAARFR